MYNYKLINQQTQAKRQLVDFTSWTLIKAALLLLVKPLILLANEELAQPIDKNDEVYRFNDKEMRSEGKHCHFIDIYQ